MVLTSTPNKSAILFCDIQNVSLLKMTSTRASPCAVLYNNILELSELCISSAIETDCEKKPRACWTSNFLPSAFSAIIIHAIRESRNIFTLRNEPFPILTISTAWLKCSSTFIPFSPTTLMALSMTR